MNKLTEPMKKLIATYSAGAVATTNEDGTPAVSPKATFVVVDDTRIAFGNIRSPGTVANIRSRPDVEVNFIDVLARRAVRVKGRAEIVEKESEAGRRMAPAFEELWGPMCPTCSASSASPSPTRSWCCRPRTTSDTPPTTFAGRTLTGWPASAEGRGKRRFG